MEEEKILRGYIKSSIDIFVTPILRLIQEDPHLWSTRPCSSCKTISSMIGRPFGCYLYTAIRKKKKGG